MRRILQLIIPDATSVSSLVFDYRIQSLRCSQENVKVFVSAMELFLQIASAGGVHQQTWSKVDGLAYFQTQFEVPICNKLLPKTIVSDCTCYFS